MSETIDTSELKKIAYEVNRDILNGPNILPYLLAGGAGALVGGAATAIQPRGKDESRLRRLYRVLRNATLLGGAVGGGSALIGNAAKTVDTALPAEDKVMTEGIGDALGNKTAWKAILPGALAAKMYHSTYKSDQAGMSRFLEKITGRDYGVDPERAYKEFKGRTGNSSNPELAAQHPHARYADHVLETGNRFNESNAKVDGANVRHIPVLDQHEVRSKFKEFGYSPDHYNAGASRWDKMRRSVGDTARMHGGRIAGRSTAAKAFRIPALAAAYFAPDVVSKIHDSYNSTDPSLYE
jgi:hypothetical protein